MRKRFIYGKLLRHTNKALLRFLLRDTLHEAFFTSFKSLFFLFKDLFQKHSEVASVGLSDFTAKTREGLGSERTGY